MSALKDPYFDLSKAGVPLSLCTHLKELNLHFGNAVWTAKQTKSGFSISFFWNNHVVTLLVLLMKSPVQSKNAGGRRQNPKGLLRVKASSKSLLAQCPQLVPTIVHIPVPAVAQKSKTEPVDDLATSNEDSDAGEHVGVEVRPNVVEVKYVNNGMDGWTAVVKRNKRSRKSSTNVNSTDSDVNISGSRDTHYEERDDIPGICTRTGSTNGNVSWTPININSIHSAQLNST